MAKSTGAPRGKEEGLMAPTSNSSAVYYFTNNYSMDYGGIAFSVWVQCPLPMELSACFPTFHLVVPISVFTQEIHYGICRASHVVEHNTYALHKANKVLPFLEDPFLCTKHLREIVQGFQTFLIKHCT